MIKNYTFFVFLSFLIINPCIAQDNNELSEGARVLFGYVQTTLSVAQKNQIYRGLGFVLNKDGKTFFIQNLPTIITAYVYPVNLKEDNEEQIFIYYGKNIKEGDPASMNLFIKNKNGDYKIAATEVGLLPFVYNNSSLEYPDLLFPIVLDNKTSYQAYRWNGNFGYEKFTGSDYALDKGVSAQSISNTYTSDLLTYLQPMTQIYKGTKIMFKDVKTKLTDAEQIKFYLSLNYRLNKDSTFCFETDEQKFKAHITTLDINKDGQEDLLLSTDYDLVKGGETIQNLFMINKYSTIGNYRGCLNILGKTPYVFYNISSSDFPDLVFVDDSNNQSVYKWNIPENRYKISDGEKYDISKGVPLTELSKKYASELTKSSSIYSSSNSNTHVKVPCSEFPSAIDDFSPTKPNYHSYFAENEICRLDEFKKVSKEKIFSILLKHNNYVAPTFDTLPVQNCTRVYLNIGAVGPVSTPSDDPIVTVIDNSNYLVTNYTLEGHRLHAGKVIRQIVEHDNKFYIQSVGTGNNESEIYGFLNSIKMGTDMLWGKVDQPFIEEVRKELKNDTITPNKRQTFKILPEWVTHPTDKSFKWYDWDEAPADLKAAANYVDSEDIKEVLTNNCSVQISAIDLDNNGVCGIAISESGSYCCGSHGCTFDLFEDGGLKMVNYSTHDELKPGLNFTFNSDNNLGGNKQKIIKLFTYDTTGLNLNKPVVIGNLLGGSTPEELGKIMLKALQTNNKKLWASCVHPTYDIKNDPNHKQKVVDEFDRIREDFEEEGLADWNQVVLSRVTFNRCNSCAPLGEQWLTEMHVEFWYKNKEFLGQFGFSPVYTYNGGNYFVGSNYTRGLVRVLK